MGLFDRFRRAPADDWSAFAGVEHMFFGLKDPHALIRREVERGLREQIAGTVVHAIRTTGKPLFLTIGKKTDDPTHVVVSFFGFAVAATISASANGARHELVSTLTFVFGRVDEPGEETSRSFIDLGADAAAGFTDDAFRARFLAFRGEHP